MSSSTLWPCTVGIPGAHRSRPCMSSRRYVIRGDSALSICMRETLSVKYGNCPVYMVTAAKKATGKILATTKSRSMSVCGARPHTMSEHDGLPKRIWRESLRKA
eukprot:scaffold673_cov410-Prasinococcus_capsulatus_cf.AAC.3